MFILHMVERKHFKCITLLITIVVHAKSILVILIERNVRKDSDMFLVALSSHPFTMQIVL